MQQDLAAIKHQHTAAQQTAADGPQADHAPAAADDDDESMRAADASNATTNVAGDDDREASAGPKERSTQRSELQEVDTAMQYHAIHA